MKKIRALLALFLCLVIFVAPVLAADETTAATPDDASQSADTSAEAAVSAAPEYHANAKAALLIDLNTGRTIYEQDADEPSASSSGRAPARSARGPEWW